MKTNLVVPVRFNLVKLHNLLFNCH